MGIWFLSLLINSGCNRDLVEYDSNDLKISIEKGEEWLHNFPLFLGINIKNPHTYCDRIVRPPPLQA